MSGDGEPGEMAGDGEPCEMAGDGEPKEMPGDEEKTKNCHKILTLPHPPVSPQPAGPVLQRRTMPHHPHPTSPLPGWGSQMTDAEKTHFPFLTGLNVDPHPVPRSLGEGSVLHHKPEVLSGPWEGPVSAKLLSRAAI